MRDRMHGCITYSIDAEHTRTGCVVYSWGAPYVMPRADGALSLDA